VRAEILAHLKLHSVDFSQKPCFPLTGQPHRPATFAMLSGSRRFAFSSRIQAVFHDQEDDLTSLKLHHVGTHLAMGDDAIVSTGRSSEKIVPIAAAPGGRRSDFARHGDKGSNPTLIVALYQVEGEAAISLEQRIGRWHRRQTWPGNIAQSR